MRGAVVGVGDGDVKVEGGVERDLCDGAGRRSFVDPRATSSVEKIVSSVVSLQACLTGLSAQRFFFGAALRARAKEERTISSPQLLFKVYVS